MKCGCVIVETRCIPNIREIVENHIHFTDWPVTFFCGSRNTDFLLKELEGLNVSFINMHVLDIGISDYNNLLTSVKFWEVIPYDKILVFQHDSRLLRKGIEDFLQYDFIGAPIKHIRFPLMNGGLSLRTKKIMIDICRYFKYRGDVNEDMFLCDHVLAVNGKLPTIEVAKQFGVETIYGLNSFGVHAIKKWLTPEQCETILNQYSDKGILASKR